MTEENIYDGSDDTSKTETGQAPFLTNNDDGAAAWLETDRNGNVYVSVSLPLGLGSLALFARSDAQATYLNQLYAAAEDEGDL